MSFEIFNIVAPIFLIAAIGYFIERRGNGFHGESLTRLVMWVGTPSLVFSSLTRTELPADDLSAMMLYAVVVVLVGGALSLAALALLRLPVRAYLPPLALPNSGNAGLPVVLFAFSDDGLAIGVAFFFTIAMTQYLVVPVIMAGRFQWRSVVREPLVWSIVAVVAVKGSGLEPPKAIAETTHILGGMVIPVMLVMLGGALARLRVGDLATSAALAVLRLGIGVAAGTVVIILFGLDGIVAGAVFLLSAMPAAVVTYVFAERYGRSPERVAGLVVCSTVVTFLALPALVAVALGVAGG
ncbi:MAG: AEC family transporter [Pseudomonadota bacterium]